jgi:hypothetical protein
VYLRVESGPVQLLIGNHEGTAFVELVVAKEGVPGEPVRTFELRGAEVTALARLVELARAELKRAGGSKR